MIVNSGDGEQTGNEARAEREEKKKTRIERVP